MSSYHDARSPECQVITMHGHLNVKSSLYQKETFYALYLHDEAVIRNCDEFVFKLICARDKAPGRRRFTERTSNK